MARRSLPAFTMIEAMVTLAIAGIIAAAAAATMALVLRTTASTRAGLAITNHLGLTAQFLTRDIENAGGIGLPGQAAIVVENGDCLARDGMPACAGNDRLTVFLAVTDAPVCAVRAGSRPDTLSFQYVQGGCCFPSTAAGQPVRGVVMLTTTAGAFRPARVTGVAGAVCEFAAENALPQALYLDVDLATANVAADDFSPFENGEATVVQMRTYYVDPNRDLRVKHGDAGFGLVAANVFDFQVALGVDGDGDGVVEDSEWAYRESDGFDVDPRVQPTREVLVSLVQGMPASLRPDRVPSPLRPPGGDKVVVGEGFALRAALVHLVPYNTLLREAP